MASVGKITRFFIVAALLISFINGKPSFSVMADGGSQIFLPAVYQDYYAGPMPPEYYIDSHNGPTGGTVTSVKFVDSQPGVVYAASWGAGVFKSTNSGRTWDYANQGLTNGRIYSVAVDPTNPNIVYAGTFGDGVFKSTDGGATWTQTGQLNTGAVVYALAVNPLNPNVIFAGTRGDHGPTTKYCYGNDSGGFPVYDYGGGVYRSKDGGKTWSKMDGGIACGFVYGLTIGSNGSGGVIIYVATHQVGILKSVDGGDTFNYANLWLGDKSTRSIAVDPNSPNIVYVSTWHTEGVAVSQDYGDHWSSLNKGIQNQRVVEVSVDGNGTRYALLWGIGLFRLPAGNTVWSSTGAQGYNGYDMAINPSDSRNILFGLQMQGVFASFDSGSTWGSSNYGMNNVDINSLSYGPLPFSTLYAGSGSLGVLKSADGGISWQAARNGLPLGGDGYYYPIYAVAVDPVNPDIMYAGTSNNGVYKSDNGGASWKSYSLGFPVEVNELNQEVDSSPFIPHPQVSDPYFLGEQNIEQNSIQTPVSGAVDGRTVLSLAIDPTNPSIIYAGTGLGVLKSTDGASSWRRSGFYSQNVFAIAIDPQNSSMIYAGTVDGVYLSINGGKSWDQIGLKGIMVYSVAVDPTNKAVVYAGTATQGIFTTYDGGDNWFQNNLGLGDLHIYSVIVDPTQPLFQYAGTAGGFYRSTKGGSRWELIKLSSYFGYIDPVCISSNSPKYLNLGTNSGTITVRFYDELPVYSHFLFLPEVMTQLPTLPFSYPAP